MKKKPILLCLAAALTALALSGCEALPVSRLRLLWRPMKTLSFILILFAALLMPFGMTSCSTTTNTNRDQVAKITLTTAVSAIILQEQTPEGRAEKAKQISDVASDIAAITDPASTGAVIARVVTDSLGRSDSRTLLLATTAGALYDVYRTGGGSVPQAAALSKLAAEIAETANTYIPRP